MPESQARENGEPITKGEENLNDDLRDEYDFSGGVRGKYYRRYREGTNLVLLEADLAKVFRDSETVNAALRQFLAEHGKPPRSS